MGWYRFYVWTAVLTVQVEQPSIGRTNNASAARNAARLIPEIFRTSSVDDSRPVARWKCRVGRRRDLRLERQRHLTEWSAHYVLRHQLCRSGHRPLPAVRSDE